MTLVHLGKEHYTAINYLSLTKRGGLTMQEIADKCGVSRQSLYNWLDDPKFASELKKRIIRNSRIRLPEVVEAMSDAVIEDKNAAMAKLLLQMNDMLTDPVSVDDKLTSAADKNKMQARIDEYKKRQEGNVK